MAHSYDIATARGQVRLLARDTNPDEHLFEDDEIDAFLALSNNAVLLAAATAVEAVAADETLTLKRIKLLGDLETDGPAEASALRAYAQSLRRQWRTLSEEGGYFGWAEFADDQFQAIEHIVKSALRRG